MEQNNKNIEKAERISKKIIENILEAGSADKYDELTKYKSLEENLTSEEFYTRMDSRAKLHNKESSAENLVKKLNRFRLRKKTIHWSSIAVAASVILAGILLIPNLLTDSTLPDESLALEKKPLSAHKPFVITSSGETIQLNEDFQLLPTVSEAETLADDKSSEDENFNTIIVPIQTTYGIQLDDGSRIKLNGGSSLKYSNKFGVKERKVLLTGEAFFHVAKSDIPFVVECNSVNIKVLGTTFNVNSYRKASVETVLVNGSVAVCSDLFSEEIIMEPGYLVDISVETGTWKKEKVDTNVYIGWTNDRFYFNGSSLTVILRQIESYFNTTITYDSNINADSIMVSASLNRNMSLEEIITTLEEVTNVKIKISGDDINNE